MRARTATLIALFALAGGVQALAPGSAAAMDNVGDYSAICQWLPPTPPEWGATICSTETAGGTAGGATGDTAGSETIVIVDPVSPSACRTPSSCLPSQSGGGRGSPSSDDGSDPREPKRGGSPGSADPAVSKWENCNDTFELLAALHAKGVPAEWARIQKELDNEKAQRKSNPDYDAGLDPAYVAAVRRTYNSMRMFERKFQKEKCSKVLGGTTVTVNTHGRR